jgi:hypothetical protein
MVVMNRKGEVLLVWKEDQQVHWAVYTPEGKRTSAKGTAGRSPSSHKPTAFVGADDVFYHVF